MWYVVSLCLEVELDLISRLSQLICCSLALLFILQLKASLFIFLSHLRTHHTQYKNTAADKVVRVISDYALSMGSDIPDEGIMVMILII